MKKKLFAAVTLAAVPLLVTGCGGKKLVCETKEGGMETKYTMTFKKDKIDTIDMKYTINYSDNGISKDQIKDTDLCEIFVKGEDEFKDAVKSCKNDIGDKEAVVTATIDATKVKSDDLKTDQSYDDAKKYFTETLKMTCK